MPDDFDFQKVWPIRARLAEVKCHTDGSAPCVGRGARRPSPSPRGAPIVLFHHVRDQYVYLQKRASLPELRAHRDLTAIYERLSLGLAFSEQNPGGELARHSWRHGF